MDWIAYLGGESLTLAVRMVTLTLFYAGLVALPMLGMAAIVRRVQQMSARRVQVRRQPRRPNPVQIID